MTTSTQPTSPSTPHRYFVSYAIPNGFGNTQIAVPRPIRGMPDVKVIADLLSEQNGGVGVVVLNFIPLPA